MSCLRWSCLYFPQNDLSVMGWVGTIHHGGTFSRKKSKYSSRCKETLYVFFIAAVIFLQNVNTLSTSLSQNSPWKIFTVPVFLLFVIHFWSKAKSFDRDPLLFSLIFPTFFFHNLFFCAFFINLVLIKEPASWKPFKHGTTRPPAWQRARRKPCLSSSSLSLKREKKKKKSQEGSPVGLYYMVARF